MAPNLGLVTHPAQAHADELAARGVALWVRTLDGWKLVDFAVGLSDAFYISWPEQYGMPADLLK